MSKRIVFEKFDSLDAFARSLERKPNRVFASATLVSRREGDKKWAGTDSFEEAMNLFNNGWTEKADEIRKAFVEFERVEQRTVSYEKSRPAASVVGFTPHVPNAILGLPNSMIYTERQPMKAKVVRIIYNMVMCAGTSNSDIMNSGLAVLKIAHSMEKKGYRVRIDVTPKFSECGSEIACATVCVKDWRQPIDIKKVAFPIANTAMFRRLGFAWTEVTPDLTNSSWTGGYGRSFEDPEKEKKYLEEFGVLGDNDYFVDVPIAQRNNFDPARIANEIGIKNL